MTVPFSEQPRVNVQMTLFDFMEESEKERYRANSV